MARLLKQSEAKRLGLPGRTSLEPVSGEIGSRVTFRIAEVAVPKAGRQAARPAPAPRLRGMHLRAVRARAMTVAESGEIPIKPGDIVLIPPSEKHMTRNTGSEPLVLLCFFPEPDVSARHRRISELLRSSMADRRPLPAAGSRFRARRCAAAGVAAGDLSRAR